LQLIANDKLRSARHRVFSGEVGPRISIIWFLYPGSAKNLKQYGIIKELQHGNPAIYRETDTAELREEIRVSGPSTSTLSRFKE
jgi:isopenicillin N synthase-like dioxygenase